MWDVGSWLHKPMICATRQSPEAPGPAASGVLSWHSPPPVVPDRSAHSLPSLELKHLARSGALFRTFSFSTVGAIVVYGHFSRQFFYTTMTGTIRLSRALDRDAGASHPLKVWKAEGCVLGHLGGAGYEKNGLFG